jgi:hypothetical protein
MRFFAIVETKRRDLATCRGQFAGLEFGERANIRHIGVER